MNAAAALVQIDARVIPLPQLVPPLHYCDRHDDGTPARYALTIDARRSPVAVLCVRCTVRLVR